MALNAYLTLKGQKSGTIKGGVTRKGNEGSIAVIAVQHQVVSPRDSASGMATGKRQHKPIIITKEIDKSSPLLMQALVNNENLKEAVLKFYGASAKSGTEALIYTIKLTNASIVHIELDMENNKMDPGNTLPVMEYVGLTYQKIEWTWADGGITTTDDWETLRP